MAKKCGYQMKSGVIIYDFRREPYRLESTVENPPVLTVMNNLVLSNDRTEYLHVLKNVLLDYGAIERTSLVDREEKAWSILRGELGKKNIIKTVYLPTGRRLYIKGESEVNLILNI